MSTPLPQRVPKNAPGDFYVERGLCTKCCLPHGEAPNLLNDPNQPFEECYFRRQPQTPQEIDQAINAICVSQMCALRYGGRDPEIIRKLRGSQCDHLTDAAPQPPESEKRTPTHYTLPQRRSSLRQWLTTLLVIGVITLAMVWWMQHRSMPWAAARALDNAEQYELFSLYPRMSEDEFHNHRILGHSPVIDPAMRKRLTDALKKAARDSDGRMMSCFQPRHGLRVTRGAQVTDFVICFECLHLAVWRDGQKIAYFTISDSQAAVFNDAVLSLGLPPAPKEP